MKFRKKPVLIEAIQFGPEGNAARIIEWANEYKVFIRLDRNGLHVHTLEGVMLARRNDWIIKGVRNEFYPCNPEIFSATYEPVTPEPTRQDEME